MFISIDQPLELASTLLGGQAFRWRGNGVWHDGVVFDNLVGIRQQPTGIEFRSFPDDEAYLEPFLRDYLGLGADLERIYASLAKDDRLEQAIARHRGLRILRQDPWECLVSFICSSASNIPRITRNIESLCVAFGRPLGTSDDRRSAFPTPAALAEAEPERLRRLGLGYRADYLAATARAIADGRLDLMSLREASYQEALDALMALDGVGDKVANCVLLFSLDKTEAFPVDVWIHRALEEWYLSDAETRLSRLKMRPWAQERFGPYAGYANQYMFHYRRLQGRGKKPNGATLRG